MNTLPPGTPEHRLATNVLLLMQDALFLLSETEILLREVKNGGRAGG